MFCRFCGLSYDSVSHGTNVQILVADSATRWRVRRWFPAIVGLLVLVAVVPGLVVAFIGWRAAGWARAVADRPTSPRTASSSARAGRTPRQLGDLPPGVFSDLDVAATAGGYGAVDPVAALPWALAIAQAWAHDARLERIDVSRLRPDGTVNAQDDAEARLQYRFVSPARLEELRRQAPLSRDAEAGVGLWVRVAEGRPQAFVESRRGLSSRRETPPHPAVQPLPDVLRDPAVRRAMKPAPFYGAYLIHLDREGWVWYVSTLNNETTARIRARDATLVGREGF